MTQLYKESDLLQNHFYVQVNLIMRPVIITIVYQWMLVVLLEKMTIALLVEMVGCQLFKLIVLEELKICVIQKLAIVSLKYKTHVKNAIVPMF